MNQLAMEFQRERDVLEHGVKSVDELKTLKRQFGSWKKSMRPGYGKRRPSLKISLMLRRTGDTATASSVDAGGGG